MPNDFNIPMSDAQITQALQLMVERVSEGWAQETYDGSPVGSGSPYYHKSSKWWATQAADAAARAEAAVPAGTAGAVFFDRAQSLTDSQKAQARQNIQAGATNPNLLDNPFFQVNQRGATSGTGSSAAVYASDRWIVQYADYTINSDKSITLTTTGNNYGIRQRIPYDMLKQGETYTLSAIINGTLKSVTFAFTTGYQPYFDGTNIRPFIGVNSTNYWEVWIAPAQSGTTFTISAVKLEIGSVSTLANDAAPNYAEELAKCQRYFQRVAFPPTYGDFAVGHALSATDFRCFIPLPVSLRTTPTVSINGIGALRIIGQGLNFVPSAMSGTGYFASGVNLAFTTTGLSAGQVYVLVRNTADDGYIDLSADL